MRTRKAIKKEIQTKILLESGRRCALCFGLYRDFGVKSGQIAHLDHDKSNSKEENLVFLCLVHHDKYDGKTSQAKGITEAELRGYKSRLITAMRVERNSQISSSSRRPPRVLAPVAIGEVLQNWKAPAEEEPTPVFMVVGGSSKYDSSRKSLGLKDQSTEPILGVVRVARSLSHTMGSRFIDAVCDYSSVIRSKNSPIDIVLVGAGDTNRVTKEIFLQNVSNLPVRFEPSAGSDAIVVPGDGESWSSPEDGLVLALKDPLRNVRYAIVCAGNGARGTNAALTSLAHWLTKSDGGKPLKKMETAVVIQSRANSEPIRLWPP